MKSTTTQPRRVIAASLFGYAGVAIQTVLMLVLTPFVIRHVGLESFGVWAVVNGLLAFTSLLEAPSALAAIKYISRTNTHESVGKIDRLVSNLLATQLGLAAPVLVGVAIFAFGWPGLLSPDVELRGTARIICLIVGGAIAVNFPLGLSKSLLAGMGRQVEVHVLGIIGSLLNAACVVGSLRAGFGLMGLSIAAAASLLLPGILAWFRVYRLLPSLRVSPRHCSRDQLCELAGFGGASFVTNVAMTVVRRIDVLLLSGPLGLGAVAVFQVAARVADQAQMFLCQLANALTPAMGELFGGDDSRRRAAWFLHGSLISLSLAIVPCIFLIMEAEDLLVWWVGQEFLGAVVPLRILAISLLIGCLEDHTGNVLSMGGRHRALAAYWVIIAVTKIVASLVLLPHWGLAAPAAGTLIASVIGKIFLAIPDALRLLRVTIVKYVRSVLMPTLIAAGMVVVLLIGMGPMATASLPSILTRLIVAAYTFGVVFAFAGMPADIRDSIWSGAIKLVRSETWRGVFSWDLFRRQKAEL